MVPGADEPNELEAVRVGKQEALGAGSDSKARGDRKRAHTNGLELVNQAMCSQSEQFDDAQAQLLVCQEEHMDQLVIIEGNEKKAKIRNEATHPPIHPPPPPTHPVATHPLPCLGGVGDIEILIFSKQNGRSQSKQFGKP